MIERYATEWADTYSPCDLQLATTEADILHVYAEGPRSCMQGEDCVRVYAAGDLAVAYVTRDGKIIARSVCWPDKHIFSRTYGDAIRLENALARAGYSEGSDSAFKGARLLRVDAGDDTFLCPFLDFAHTVDDNGSFLIIGRGDIGCRNTTGYTDGGQTCSNCSERISEHDSYSCEGVDGLLCESCYCENVYTCEKCEESYWGDDSMRRVATTRGDAHWCEHCADTKTLCCYDCDAYCAKDHADEWVEVDSDLYCGSCAERRGAERCEACEDYSFDCVEPSDSRERYCESCLDSHTFLG